MITLNKNTKKAKGFVNSFNFYRHKNESYDILTFYKKPSNNKINAWNYCKELASKNNGNDLHICGGNSSVFSAGFTMMENDKKYLVYITRDNEYKIEL